MIRQEIRISGFGGQGVILMGYITGKAAAINEKKHATLTQSYGPEARGGACSVQVIVSDEKISYPILTSPDILVVMSQAAYNLYRKGLKPGGTLIYDSLLVTPDEIDKEKAFSIPANKIAKQMGRQIVTNIIMLGFLAQVTQVVSRESMRQAIESAVPPHTLELNMEAFKKGYEYKP